MLSSSSEPLVARHDLVMFDLDGVVYISGHLIAGVAEALEGVRSVGGHVAFVTNNAARTPETVAEHLNDLGVRAEAGDVVTSAQAAAAMALREHGTSARVLVLGADGLVEALRSAGLRPVLPGEGEEDVVAVATGYGPEVRWKDLMRAATRIRQGLPWIASNTDMSLPTDYGLAPGHGVQVAMLRDFAEREPLVAGKPSPPLLRETIARVGGDRPLMVGDRLDTDIEGAHAVGVPSLLVLTGVTGLSELVAAEPQLRPTYLHPSLAGLHETHPHVEVEGTTARLETWTATVRDGRLEVEGSGSSADWWRVAATAAWAHLDTSGEPADVSGVETPAEG